jgi:hypothetical protein
MLEADERASDRAPAPPEGAAEPVEPAVPSDGASQAEPADESTST